MKLAYFDCFSGISGDMALGAMVDVGLPIAKLRSELKKLNLDGYTISASKVKRCGIAGTKVTVRLTKKSTHHRLYPDIVKMIEKSGLSDEVKKRALDIFGKLAQAESKVHGEPMEKIHFHEVGAVDSIVDIVGASIGFCELGIGEVQASAINAGSGTVKTSHGILPVPAPATAFLLEGVPAYAEGPQLELTTPTGASILKSQCVRFGPLPMMTVERIGHGAGGHDFADRPNITRLFIGETEAVGKIGEVKVERLLELVTNIDDMNPEAIPSVFDALFTAGALDVTITPIQMKKGRPGVCLSVLCEPDKSVEMEKILFEQTSTLGVRRREVRRASLPRRIKKVKTRYGVVEVKVAQLPDGKEKSAPEFTSVRKAAVKNKVSFETVYRAALLG
ncbi:hypothetical protein MNBD_NITROSPINAE04-2246 [hydrothermal vent metagenome]|uniref:Nickel insertion protein n=1 Tax=hydrothermal vent metagenome TaxID=652676 RepID=A0A3B1C8W8_9ZZZZ